MELAQNTLPLGKFDPIYPDTMFEEIRLPRDASTSERLSHRRWAESQTKMRLHNDKVKAARDAWWSNALNLYFDSSSETHPPGSGGSMTHTRNWFLALTLRARWFWPRLHPTREKR